jgi:hypothetical protein
LVNPWIFPLSRKFGTSWIFPLPKKYGNPSSSVIC